MEQDDKEIKFCEKCGAKMTIDAVYCPVCGNKFTTLIIEKKEKSVANKSSNKSRLIAFLFCFFLGVIGIHRFYVGKIGTAILMIFTYGGFGIWYLIDLIMIIGGSFTDKDGKKVLNWSME